MQPLIKKKTSTVFMKITCIVQWFCELSCYRNYQICFELFLSCAKLIYKLKKTYDTALHVWSLSKVKNKQCVKWLSMAYIWVLGFKKEIFLKLIT